jgi:hypothetical protein
MYLSFHLLMEVVYLITGGGEGRGGGGTIDLILQCPVGGWGAAKKGGVLFILIIMQFFYKMARFKDQPITVSTSAFE